MLMDFVEWAAQTNQRNVNTQLKALRQNLQETFSSTRRIILRTRENLSDVNSPAACHQV